MSSAVIAALEDVDSFVSTRQLYARLRRSGELIGLTTVYRTLQQLAEDGAVDVIRMAERGSKYHRRRSGDRHLACRSCWCAIEVDSAVVEVWARKVAEDNSFVDVGAMVEISGICAKCGAAPHR